MTVRAVLIVLATLTTAGYGQAGQRVGTVALKDANVSTDGRAMVEGASGRATLVGSSTVTAKNRTAQISLERGGSVRVCQTSALHVTPGADTSLLLALDRGAFEIKSKASTGDVLLTPDLRFTMAAGGSLDLRMRVTFNGDTCVENRGHKAPLLSITDAFGEASYQVKPGQHVLFEHGSLREVVDQETTPCGCPPDERPGVSIAEAALHGGPNSVTAKQSEAAHPFPAAQSEGLAPPPPLAAEKAGETHVQVSTTLSYNPATAPAVQKEDGQKEDQAASASPTPAPVPPAAPAATTKSGRGPVKAVGHFFKRIFVR